MAGPSGNGPSRRLSIRHRTGYRYADVVEASFNEVRMTPLSGDGQFLISHSLEVHPQPSVQTYRDYWGAWVEAFDVHVPHRILEVVATSTVDTATVPMAYLGGTWADLRSEAARDRWAEFLVPTEYVDSAREDASRAVIAESMLMADSPRSAARMAVEATRERMSYVPGSTNVLTTAAQAWAAGTGVCQDFAHTTLSLLRSAGIPARYVSGYLHTESPAPGKTVTGESHAWVDYWDGTWHAIDPTNDRAVGAAHVTVARGRDYADVPPLKGIYAGGESEGLGVTVEITQQ